MTDELDPPKGNSFQRKAKDEASLGLLSWYVLVFLHLGAVPSSPRARLKGRSSGAPLGPLSLQ